MSDSHINSSTTQEVTTAKVAQAFRSKKDFVSYFQTNLQLFCPPFQQITKEWLRVILSGEKKLMKLAEIKPVSVGSFPEVSVKHLYDDFANRPEISPYMPNQMAKGRQIDKSYFFTIVNSVFHEELQSIIQHANAQRNAVEQAEQKQEAIIMSEEMAAAMFKFPFQSKTRGKTVHLLKNNSKRIRVVRPRKTFDVLSKEKRQSLVPQPERVRPTNNVTSGERASATASRDKKYIKPTVVEKFDTNMNS